MEIFGIGPLELGLVLFLGLLVLGPQKMVEASRTAGSAVRQFKTQTDELRKLVSVDAVTAPRQAVERGEPVDERVLSLNRYYDKRDDEKPEPQAEAQV